MTSNTEFKIHKQTGYTIMSNELIRDKNISLKSKALLSLMLSLPDDWDYSVAGLTSLVKEGYDAVDSALKELIKYDYIYRIESRKEKGLYKYIYHIFENPKDNYFKDRNQRVGGKRVPVKRIAVNPEQQNKDNKIDKIDKTEIEHNILTKELINLNYIDSDDISSFYYDNLFHKYLSEGKSYKELFMSIHYIVPKVVSKNFEDENGTIIENKYGYFKNALESNFKKFEIADEIWSETDLTNEVDSFIMNSKEGGDLYR